MLSNCKPYPSPNGELYFESISSTPRGLLLPGYFGKYRFDSTARSVDEMERITPENINMGNYDWSHDKEWVIYMCEKPEEWVGICRNDKNGENFETWLTDIDFGDYWYATPIASSPGGNLFAFGTTVYENDSPKYSFFIFDIDMKAIVKSHEFITAFALISWSPEGKTIVLRKNPDELYLLDVETLDMEYLSQGAFGEWSPDGKQFVIALGVEGASYYEIFVMNMETKEMKFLTYGRFPTWSPDGKKYPILIM